MKHLTLSILLMLISQSVFASLLVTPTRVVFDHRDRTAEVVVVNTSNTEKNYKVEWINQAQGQGGGYVQLSEQELLQFPRADQYIRFAPRRVTLQPGESQTIKLMARRKNDMSAAEYRSHLRFTALPDTTLSSAAQQESSSGVNIRLNMLLSYSIPVVMRTTKPETTVSLSDLNLINRPADGKEALEFKVNKAIPNSVYGNFTIIHEHNGQQTEVGYLNGVNIFSELEHFKTNIVLLQPVREKGGKLTLVYKGTQEFADTLKQEAKLVIN